MINRRFEAKWFNTIWSSLKQVGKEVGNMVERLGPEEAQRRLTTEFINTGISAEVNNLWKDVGLFHANRQYRELVREEKKALGFSAQWTAKILEVLRMFLVEKVLFAASETTKKMLLKVIGEGIEQGWGIDKIVDELENFDGLRYQAARIVRTEVNRAANLGKKTGAESFPYEQNKIWIATHDFRTRGNNPDDHADHLRMDGQTVPLDAKFIDPRNGEGLDFPGDPEAPPSETVNCRCTQGFVGQRDERGRLIPKQTQMISMRT